MARKVGTEGIKSEAAAVASKAAATRKANADAARAAIERDAEANTAREAGLPRSDR